MKNLKHTLLISAVFGLMAQTAQAESSLDDWEVSGSNTLRHDQIYNDGNSQAGPYPINGGHTYNEFDVNVNRNFTPYSSIRAQFFGIVNGSDYRHPDEGMVPERMSIQMQSGETAIPMRVEAGDYFANLSYRTLQRSLKGAQAEFQPRTNYFGAQHSILFFSGTDQPFWRHFDLNEDRYEGASWLMSGGFGQISLNTVHNNYEGISGLGSQSQWVNSIAYTTPLRVGSEKLNIETELAHFNGDYVGTTAMEDESDFGFFGEVRGRSDAVKPLDYRIRHENYGADYQPRGSIITTNRVASEAFVGWRFDNGLYLQGRGQLFEDAAHRGNERDTNIFGVRLTGPLLGDRWSDVSGTLNAYRQDVTTEDGTTDFDSLVIDFSLAKPINDVWTGELLGFYQEMDDDTATNADQNIQQIGLRFSKTFEWNGFTGSYAPGITLRNIDATFGDSVEIHPTFDITAFRDGHRLNASYGWFNQNYDMTTVAVYDTTTQTAGLNYAYAWDIHEVGVEAFWFDRNIDTLQDTETGKVGVYWTVNFYKPAGGSFEAQPNNYGSGQGQIQPPAMFADATGIGTVLVPHLQLGESVESQLDAAPLALYGEPVKIGRAQVYETTYLDAFSQRQRLALVSDSKGKLDKLALIVEADSDGRPDRLAQVYARLLDTLIARFGAPTTVYEEGDFSGRLMADIQNGQFIRTVEWKRVNSTIRFGIPRRTDGQVRFEVQEAESFTSPRNPSWGVNIR